MEKRHPPPTPFPILNQESNPKREENTFALQTRNGAFQKHARNFIGSLQNVMQWKSDGGHVCPMPPGKAIAGLHLYLMARLQG